MIPAQRENYIIEKLSETGTIKVEDLASELGVSLMTIRRDLDRLQDKGVLYRSHGGAVLRSVYPIEQSYDVKKISNIDAKNKIASAALELINEGDTIFLDAGTTTLELAKLLKTKKNLTVITDDLKIALELYKSNVETYIVGGRVQKDTACIIGPTAEDFIKNIKVNLCFLGTSSITSDGYLSTPTFEKAYLKREVVRASSYSVLMVDSSKFKRESFVNILSIKEINCIITNKQFDEGEIRSLEEENIRIINA
ncbi:DeoR faimly transcriptional regulator [Clostridium novyi A str. 4570]|uniref:DeoR faimly transcriptional regulator n=1 Tax=Clostridium novyi A str. 4570 TaxID=1444290 RepID=A0AA88ZKI9_CLONO|nr:DeoR/GlpR family DNA-binding transcription regulator [Clostridium novyi]KGN01196.1 DeoR faimly transcriptional regulator [Clostridium novyi A str. 4570]